jgi:outer membrane receptor protein involved in Fe transport
VVNGPRTESTDLLYATATKREAFAAYTQAYWTINETFSLTLGLRYAEDEVDAEETCSATRKPQGLRGMASSAAQSLGITNGLAAYNIINGGLVQDG